MAGYNDTRDLIISALMGRPAGTEIQPENHQAYALNMLDYIRSVELVSTSTLIGIAEENTVPVQPNDSRVCYIAGVGQDRTVVFNNFIDNTGNPISITTGEMEGVFVILLWNMEHWAAYTFNTNIISSAESANFYYGYNIRKTYASVAAMNADSVNPIGTDGRLIKIGELVTVVNSITPAENGYYSYEGSENGWLLQSGFSFEIVQTTGTDINKTMSQKAITDEIAQLASDVEQLAYVKIKNEADNGNFENGLMSPFFRSDGGGGESTIAINSSSPISGNYDIRLTITTPSTYTNRPILGGLNGAANIGDKIYLQFYAKILSGAPTITSIQDGESANTIYGGDIVNGRNTRIIDAVGTGNVGTIYFNSLSAVWDMQMDNFMHINLTETFGAGNEPTEEEMNLLLDILPVDYFEGEITIPAQKIMQWQQQTLKQVDDSVSQLAGEVSQITKSQAIQILKQQDSSLIFQGFAKPADDTPAATLNHAYYVIESGTVFGVEATEGELLVGDGSGFEVRIINGKADHGYTVNPKSLKQVEDEAYSPVVKLLQHHNPNYTFKGIASIGDVTPPNVLNDAYIAVESGTIFGLSVEKGDIIVGTGYEFKIDRQDVSLHDYKGLIVNNPTSVWSNYTGFLSYSTLPSALTLQSDGDYIEFTVKIPEFGDTSAYSPHTALSMGIAGEEGESASCIGFWRVSEFENEGDLYIKDSSNVWLLKAAGVRLQANEVATIRLEWTANGIDIFKNGELKVTVSSSALIIDNFGRSYHLGVGPSQYSFTGYLKEVKIRTGGITYDYPTPALSDGITNTNVGRELLELNYLTPEQKTLINRLALPDCYYSFQTGATPYFMVYVKLNANYYAGFKVFNEVDLAVRYTNHWRLNTGVIYKYEDGAMLQTSIILLTGAESESAYKSLGASDYTGGYHGDEIALSYGFYADGILIDLSSAISLTPCNEFYYRQISETYTTDDPTHELEAIHHKLTKFENRGYNTYNRYIWQKSVSMDHWYHGIVCIDKSISSEAHNEFLDRVVFDESGGWKLVTSGNDIYFSHPANGVSAHVTSRVILPTTGEENSTNYVLDHDYYHKYYRKMENINPVANDVWEGECTVKFAKK